MDLKSSSAIDLSLSNFFTSLSTADCSFLILLSASSAIELFKIRSFSNSVFVSIDLSMSFISFVSLVFLSI